MRPVDVKVIVERLNALFHKYGDAVYHRLHWIAHASYFGAVYVEGHGFYAATGGFLLVLTIVGVFLHGTD